MVPNHNPQTFAARFIEEQEELIVDDEENHAPTLIERVTGFSIARRNKKKKENERLQEPISPSFSSTGTDYSGDERLNLEIPSFLRRK